MPHSFTTHCPIARWRSPAAFHMFNLALVCDIVAVDPPVDPQRSYSRSSPLLGSYIHGCFIISIGT